VKETYFSNKRHSAGSHIHLLFLQSSEKEALDALSIPVVVRAEKGAEGWELCAHLNLSPAGDQGCFPGICVLCLFSGLNEILGWG
jgi:hypothetical protein